jgi:trimeric autotransporter adhesin
MPKTIQGNRAAATWPVTVTIVQPGEPRNAANSIEVPFQGVLNRLQDLHERVEPLELVAGVPGNNSVTTVKLADNSVTGPKIADNAVGTSEIADNSVTLNKLAVTGTRTDGKVLKVSGSGLVYGDDLLGGGGGGSSAYDIPFAFSGTVASNGIIPFVAVRDVNLESGVARALTAASATTIFTLMKNGAAVGTVTFNAGASNGAVVLGGGIVNVSSGDVLSCHAPAAVNGISSVCITLRGS